MTLAQLVYFMEIVKTKNFTEAASNLYISQSSLSYAIHSLERELNVPLFIRRPNRKIALTMYGEALYPYVAEGIRKLDEGRNRVFSAGNLGNGCDSVKIAEHRIFLIATNDHPYAGRDRISVQELDGETLIQIDANSNMDQRVKEMIAGEGIAPVLQYESDWTAQQLAVMSGKGLALSCDVMLDRRFLCKIPVDHPLAVMPLYLSWSNRQKLFGAALYVRDYFLQLARQKGAELVF